MKDLTMSFDDYISSKIKADKDFEKEFYLGYEDFKIGAMIKEMHLESGMTQDELAEKLETKKSVISRTENHSEDIRLSTLQKVASVFGKRIQIGTRKVCPCTCLHSSASLRSDSRNFCNQTDGRLGHVLQKIANNEYRWTWTVPVTAKLKMGSSLRNFQCFEIILLFDFKVLVAKSLSQILDNCIVIVFYFKPKRSVIIKIIIKWVAFVTFLSCYKDCSII